MPPSHRRHFPPITNRFCFSPERTPSPLPVWEAALLTNRQLFEPKGFVDPVETLVNRSGPDSKGHVENPAGFELVARGGPLPPDRVSGASAVTPPNVGIPEQLPARASSNPNPPLSSTPPVSVAPTNANQTPTAPHTDNSPAPKVEYISKPRGQVSKPKAGGYSLNVALAWEPGLYKSVQDGLRTLCRRFLDRHTCYQMQLPESQTRYRQEAVQKFPFLAGYPGVWPADDFATIYLKNTSSDIRRERRKNLGL